MENEKHKIENRKQQKIEYRKLKNEIEEIEEIRENRSQEIEKGEYRVKNS